MNKSQPVPSPRWEARCDFSTLCDAAKILDDPKRLKAAQAAGKKRADETQAGIEKINGLRRSK